MNFMRDASFTARTIQQSCFKILDPKKLWDKNYNPFIQLKIVFDWYIITVHFIGYNVLFWYMCIGNDKMRIINISITLSIIFDIQICGALLYKNKNQNNKRDNSNNNIK